MTETRTTPARGTEERHRLPVKTLVAASVGNAVEWYDWTVYATFSIYFATQIFPKENESLALLSTFATYALAFFFRPLGGYLLGRYADLRGRKKAMMLTITLMAGGSMAIALLPTFDQAGWLAPILLLAARIAQGMSSAARSPTPRRTWPRSPTERRGRYSAFFYISTGSAVLLASLLGAVLASQMSDDTLASTAGGSCSWSAACSVWSASGCAATWPRPSTSRRARRRRRRSSTR